MKFNVIPYKSNGLALNDLLAGQIDAVMDQVPASIGHVREGRLDSRRGDDQEAGP